jgi:hypothetical protein
VSVTPIFSGHVSDCGVLAVHEFRDYANHLRSLAGNRVEVIVRKLRSQRSLDQNAYLHGVVFPLIAAEQGDSVEGVKFDLMGEKWGWTMTKGGRHIPVKPHTAEMTVEECTQFIDWVIPWAAQTLNMRIPLPNEAEVA